MAHFAEIRGSGTFKKFDYGLETNMEKYNSEDPPVFDLKSIKDIKIALFIGDQDPYSNTESCSFL